MAENQALTPGERASARVGEVLKDKWRIDQLIGVGGMAAVYSATHRNGKRVAIKMLHKELSVDPEVKERFLREGYAANRVDHVGAVMVDDDDITEDGAAFLVMELLEGEPLDQRIERKGNKVEESEALSVADQLLATLEAAHAKGIIHRDLKPENLFLTKDGTVKVLDFGIARLRDETGETSTRATRDGSVMGTPSFMPPEQARGRWSQVDARSDIWAVGATLFTMLTGKLVHEAETPNEALAMAVTLPARSVGSVEPELSPSVVSIIDRALSFKKEDRWPDASSMRAATQVAYAEITAGKKVNKPRASISVAPPPLVDPELDSFIDSTARASMTATTGPGVSATLAGQKAPAKAKRSRGGLIFASLAAAAAVAVGATVLISGPSNDTAEADDPALAAAGQPAEEQPEPAAETEPAVVPAAAEAELVELDFEELPDEEKGDEEGQNGEEDEPGAEKESAKSAPPPPKPKPRRTWKPRRQAAKKKEPEKPEKPVDPFATRF